jgi:hypothetical protein
MALSHLAQLSESPALGGHIDQIKDKSITFAFGCCWLVLELRWGRSPARERKPSGASSVSGQVEAQSKSCVPVKYVARSGDNEQTESKHFMTITHIVYQAETRLLLVLETICKKRPGRRLLPSKWWYLSSCVTQLSVIVVWGLNGDFGARTSEKLRVPS